MVIEIFMVIKKKMTIREVVLMMVSSLPVRSRREMLTRMPIYKMMLKISSMRQEGMIARFLFCQRTYAGCSCGGVIGIRHWFVGWTCPELHASNLGKLGGLLHCVS